MEVVVTPTQAAGRTTAEHLYRRFSRDVFAVVYRAVGSRAEAEDVTQTTFLNAHQALLAGVEPEDERAWLLAIARNACRTRFRALGRRPREEPLDESLLPPRADEGAAPPQVIDALRTLLPRQRAALLLQTVDGCSTAEIGARLGLGPAAVDALLHRARAALRDELLAGDDIAACSRTETLVQSQLRDQLGADEQAGLRAHLRACSPCATAARRLRARKRIGWLLGLPWDLANRLAGLFGEGGAGVKAAALLGTIAIGTTVAVEQGGQRQHGATAGVEPAVAVAATSHPQLVLLGMGSHGAVANAPPAGGRGLRGTPPAAAAAAASSDNRPAADADVTTVGGAPAGAPESTATPPTSPPPPAGGTPGGSHPLSADGSVSVQAGAGNAAVSAGVSVGSGGAAADVGVNTGLVDANAHVSAGVSSATGATVSTQISASAPALAGVDTSAAVSTTDGVAASVTVSIAGSPPTTVAASLPVPTLPALALPVPSLPGLQVVPPLLGG